MYRASRRLQQLSGHLLPGCGTVCAGGDGNGTDIAAATNSLDFQTVQLRPVDLVLGGGKSSIAPLPQEDVNEIVSACLHAGIRDFDTAPLYEAGQSEQKLGRALLALGADDLVFDGQPLKIYTKCGRLVRRKQPALRPGELGWRPACCGRPWPAGTDGIITDDYSANGAFLSYTESRERLQGLAIHTLRIHDPDTNGGPGTKLATGSLDQALLPEGMLSGMRALRMDGKVVHVSVGMNAHPGIGLDGMSWTPSVIIDFIQAAPPRTFDNVLLAYGWNLLAQHGLPVLLCCQNAGIDVHLAGAFGGATFEPLFDPKPEHRDKVSKWRSLAQGHGVSLAAVALAFAALPRCVKKIVVGMTKVEDVCMCIAQLKENVPTSLWHDAQSQGLLHPDLQLPLH